MGFDQSTSAAALDHYDNNFERALESVLSGEFYISSDQKYLMDMGFR